MHLTSVKNAIILSSFTFTAKEQKRTESHLQLSNLQCCHFDIVILRVAIISNLQMSAFSVDTSRQTTPPLVDGVVHNRLIQQKNDTFITSLATLSLSNKFLKMHAVFCTFFSVSAVQKIIEISKIWQSCSHVYTATFYEPQQKCSFWFLQVRCAHKSGDVINVTIVKD